MIIQRFYSKPARFDVKFEMGLNLICADVEKKEEKKSTSNGAGKSTFLKLIDFCLLSDKEDKFSDSEDFQKYEFVLELKDADGSIYEIRRSIRDSDKIHFKKNQEEAKMIPLEEARGMFNRLFFDLPENESILSFRTMMNFLKRGEERGFSRIFYHFPMWDTYIANAINLFLIGLDYKLPIEKQLLNKEKESIDKTIFGLNKSLEDKKVAAKLVLKSQKALLEEQIKNRQKVLDSFRVHKEYEQLERDADRIRREIRDLQNQFFLNNSKLSEYAEALQERVEFDLKELESFYESLRISLSDNLKKKYNEVSNFHRDLIENRKNYLSDEISRLKKANENIRREIEKLDEEKAAVLRVLQTHGALSEYQSIIQRLDEEKKELYNISSYIKSYEEVADYQKKKKVFIEKIKENNEVSEKEINDSESKIKEAIVKFEEIYKVLLDVTGLLVIGTKDKYNSTDQIFEFEVRGDKKGSPGITRSQIFCYDLTILLINLLRKRRFPRFIIHDGIFNAVDMNQRENSMRFMIENSQAQQVQEIVTVNLCDVPPEINYQKYCRLKLSNNESLMGFSF